MKLSIFIPVLLTAFFSFAWSARTISSAAPALVKKGNIYYAADNQITLFVNGVLYGPPVLNWPTTTVKYVPLNYGDVVAFEVTDLHVLYGMIAAVNFFGWSSTGADPEWRAIDSAAYVDPPNAWKLPSYNACSWPSADTDEATVIPGGAGTSSSFPYGVTNAKYVWADGVAGKKTIFVRRTVGCPCPKQAKRNVHYAADDKVSMFINGAPSSPSTVMNWDVTTSLSVPLSYGDVVAYEVTDFGIKHGFIAAINVNGWSSTGEDVEWRAIDKADYTGAPDAWKLPSFDPCKWESMTVADSNVSPPNPGSSPTFPYVATQAKYVWAKNVGGGTWNGTPKTVYVRRVVGGICSTGRTRVCQRKDQLSEVSSARS